MSNKKELQKIARRCSAVVDGEMALLDDWARAAGIGRAARCLKRRDRIRTGARVRMDGALARIDALDAKDVKSAPDDYHDWMVGSNEDGLAHRGEWDVNAISDAVFTRALDRSLTNALDSVRDAEVITRDCLSG